MFSYIWYCLSSACIPYQVHQTGHIPTCFTDSQGCFTDSSVGMTEHISTDENLRKMGK